MINDYCTKHDIRIIHHVHRSYAWCRYCTWYVVEGTYSECHASHNTRPETQEVWLCELQKTVHHNYRRPRGCKYVLEYYDMSQFTHVHM